MNSPDAPFDYLNRYVKISRETYERLSLYHNLLHKWQAKINLIGPDTLADSWQRHFLDSLQLLNHIPDVKQSMFDLGTGAGFPGMVLSIAGASDVHLVESDGKKVSFLKEVARITSTQVTIHQIRLENLGEKKTSIILSRAFRPLDELLQLSLPHVSHETTCLFHKGKNWSKEIEEASEYWQFDVETIPSITDSEGVILKLRHVRKREYDSKR